MAGFLLVSDIPIFYIVTLGNNKSNYFKFLIIIILIVIIISYYIKPKLVKAWDFKGPVKDVYYDIKGYPTITINGDSYYLFYTMWHIDVQINIGDTIIKKKGDLRIKLIRQNSHDTIYYNDFSK